MQGCARYHARSSAPPFRLRRHGRSCSTSTLETLLGPAPLVMLLGPRNRTTKTPQTSGERRVACDRRVKADPADSDAPLTALCPAPMPLSSDFFGGDFRERGRRLPTSHDLLALACAAKRVRAPHRPPASRTTQADSMNSQREQPAATTIRRRRRYRHPPPPLPLPPSTAAATAIPRRRYRHRRRYRRRNRQPPPATAAARRLRGWIAAKVHWTITVLVRDPGK